MIVVCYPYSFQLAHKGRKKRWGEVQNEQKRAVTKTVMIPERDMAARKLGGEKNGEVFYSLFLQWQWSIEFVKFRLPKLFFHFRVPPSYNSHL